MKDNQKIKIFLTKDTLAEVAVFGEDFPNLNKIFRESAVFVLDMTDDELDDSLNDTESEFAQFCNSNNLNTKAEKDVLSRMLKNTDGLLVNSRSVFILDIAKADAEKMRSELGVLVLSKQDLDDGVFNLPYFRHRFVKGAIIQGDAISEWKNVLSGVSWLPTNSLIITDDYLFSETGVDVDDRANNIKGVLDAILPDKLSVDYHVLICAKHPTCSGNKRNQIIGNIKSYITSKRPYNVLIEYVFHDSLHQRKIISNYNVMVGDKGFINFNSTKKVVIDTNPTYLCTVFQNIVDSIGDTEYSMATADIEDIKKIAIEVKSLNNSGVQDYTKRIVGDCKPDKTIINRLVATV